MAERRMFSKTVINSARFLRMPQTSRLLYYDLGMAADDDGIVEAFTVLRTTGAAEDDLRVLVSKGFVVVLNEDLVSYITDWKRNNLIKTDRNHESAYHELLVKIQDGTILEPTWNQDGTHLEPESSLGKSSLGQSIPTEAEIKAFCEAEGIEINVDKFLSLYERSGWTIRGKPIRDWKALVKKWATNEEKETTGFDLGDAELAAIQKLQAEHGR